MDDAALARVRCRLAQSPPPWLHEEVARRMADRLPLFRQPPKRVADWYGREFSNAALLKVGCPQARVVRVDPGDVDGAGLPVPVSAPWWSPARWRGADALTPVASLPPESVDLLWAPMGLHWRADPLHEMQRWRSVMAIDGFLMFSTFGPGTLEALREIHARERWPVPHAPFVDMHDLGDMLVEAGFADPVMDQETITLTWPSAEALMAELRTLGGNADPSRAAGLRTPRWRRRWLSALEFLRQEAGPGDARYALSFEVVYGHAVRPPPRPRVAAETTVGLQDMRSILRGRSRG